eukprot:326471-Hanusia_phi.AAC.1
MKLICWSREEHCGCCDLVHIDAERVVGYLRQGGVGGSRECPRKGYLSPPGGYWDMTVRVAE